MYEAIERTLPQGCRHLHNRCQQRGVRNLELQALLELADRVVSVGAGRMSMTLSRNALAALRMDGITGVDLDRVARRAVVCSEDGTPITVLIPSGRSGRRYRRGR